MILTRSSGRSAGRYDFYYGSNTEEPVFHGLLVKSGRTVSDFINVAKKVKLTPCDFNSVDSGAAGCRDFISLSIFYSLRPKMRFHSP